MNYKDFACPDCHCHPLTIGDSQLICPNCRINFPIVESVPLLFPKDNLQIRLGKRDYSLDDVRSVYDKAYEQDGIMGTDLDKNYDQVTKSTLLGFADPLEGKKILDLGTGTGSLWDYTPTGVKGYAIDPSHIGAVKAYIKNTSLIISASVGESLPFSNNFFDTVIAADTIEHTFSPSRTLSEIHRVLKPTGTFSASFPIPNSLRKWGWNQIRKRQMDYKFLLRLLKVLVRRTLLFGTPVFQTIDRDLNKDEWEMLVTEAGFNICEVVEWPNSPLKPIVYLINAKRE